MATVTIQKRGNKNGNSYVITFKDPITGNKKYYKTVRKYKAAQKEVHELRTLLDSGKKPTKVRKFSPMTFAEIAVLLKDEWKIRVANQELAEKTVEDYMIWLDVLNREYGSRILVDITEEEIISYRNMVRQNKSVYSANKYLSIFKKVCRKGLNVNALVTDPSKKVKKLSEDEHQRTRFLLPNELDRLISASERGRAKNYLPAMILLGAEHGAAKQEVLSLKWSDIDFHYEENGIIRTFRTKNRMERFDSLMPRTKKALLHWRKHLEWIRHRKKILTIKSDYVFCRLDGTPLKRFDSAWKRALKLAGIDNFHFHDLRHTFCSNLMLSGTDLKGASEMIGHRDINMTNRYSHLTNSYRKELQRRLNEHYQGKN